MHCRSCEILLEKTLSAVPGMKKARTNFRRGMAEIEFDRQPSITELEKAVQNAGYQLGKKDQTSFWSRDSNDYVELVAVGSILLAIYLFIKLFGLFDFNLSVGAAPTMFTVLLIGLTAGLSSCMALVGGLVLGISARHAEIHPEATATQKFTPHLFFNLGRLLSYALLGGMIGLLGSALRFSAPVLGGLTIIIGLVMLMLGLKLIEIFPRLSHAGVFLPKAISRWLGLSGEVKEYSHRGSFVTGALTFFVPCGFTQAMQLYAISTGSFAQGALIMFLFALGTMPGLLGIGGLTSVIKGQLAKYFFKFAGLIVIILGLVNIANGYTLTGISLPSFQPEKPYYGEDLGTSSVTNPVSDEATNVIMEGGVQIARMEQANGYRPGEFTVKKGVPVKWIINSTNAYTCASYLVVPALKIQKALQPGENVIEFTPTETGYIRFMCSMGMFTGGFNVID